MIKSIQTFLFESKNDTISLFDMDDTLLYSASKIYVKLPSGKEEAVNSEEFAEKSVVAPISLLTAPEVSTQD